MSKTVPYEPEMMWDLDTRTRIKNLTWWWWWWIFMWPDKDRPGITRQQRLFAVAGHQLDPTANTAPHTRALGVTHLDFVTPVLQFSTNRQGQLLRVSRVRKVGNEHPHSSVLPHNVEYDAPSPDS